MTKERASLALKLASRIKSADRIAMWAFGNYTTTLDGSSRGYSVIVRNIEGEVISSFSLPEQEIAHGDIFVLRSEVNAATSHPNPFGGTTYNYVWEDVGKDAYMVELLLDDQVVGSKLVPQ
jgi:hypothetical protein